MIVGRPPSSFLPRNDWFRTRFLCPAWEPPGAAKHGLTIQVVPATRLSVYHQYQTSNFRKLVTIDRLVNQSVAETNPSSGLEISRMEATDEASGWAAGVRCPYSGSCMAPISRFRSQPPSEGGRVVLPRERSCEYSFAVGLVSPTRTYGMAILDWARRARHSGHGLIATIEKNHARIGQRTSIILSGPPHH